MRKLAPARVSYWDDFLISYRVYVLTGSFHILLFNGTFHVDKIHVWFKIANITHALLVPVYRQTDFKPKWVVVSRLHDTVARFRTGVLGGVYMRKLAPARVSHWDDFLISYRVYMMTGSFHILLFNGTLHVDKIHVWFKIANITHALLVPVYRQTDFKPKWVVVSRLHDTVARFRTGVKFSPRCENRGELTPG